jgi:CRISPR system Cascade subunit CasB
MALERSEAFVAWVLDHKDDKGFRAKLRKADSDTTAHLSWELLVRWVDLEKSWERQPFSLIGSSLARTKLTSDGNLGLGEGLRKLALQKAGEKELENSPEAARLRRLISCRDQEEVIGVLKPLLRYFTNKEISIRHAQLLDEILYFNTPSSQERTKLRWAKDFYRKYKSEEASQ